MTGAALDPFAAFGRRVNDVNGEAGAGAEPARATDEAANELEGAFAGLSQMHRRIDGGDRGDPRDSLRAAKAELLRQIGSRRDGARAVPRWLRGVGIALTARGSAIRVHVHPVTPQEEREIAQIPSTVRPPGVGTRTPVLVEQVGDIAAQDEEVVHDHGGPMRREAMWREALGDTGAPSLDIATVGGLAQQAGGKLDAMARGSRSTGSQVR